MGNGVREVAAVRVEAPGPPNADSFDLVERATGVDVVITDVSGRGPVSVTVGAAARVGLLSALAAGAEPGAALAATNRGLRRVMPAFTFVVAVLVRWDGARGRAVLASAGHEDVIVYRAKGRRIERLKSGGRVFGMMLDPPACVPTEVELAPGDALVLVSDGVTDAPGPDGEPFCDEAWTRALAAVTRHGHLGAGGLVAALQEEVAAWVAAGASTADASEPRDDVVIVALRRTPG